MSARDHDRAFVPFNFSSVQPFDAMAAALSDLPKPHPVQHSGPFSNEIAPAAQAPVDAEARAQMIRLMVATVNDEEWKRGVVQDFAASTNRAQGEHHSHQDWTTPFCRDIASALNASFKRRTAPLSPVKKPTPKRPRPIQVAPQQVATLPPPSPTPHVPVISEEMPNQNQQPPQKRQQLTHQQELRRRTYIDAVAQEDHSAFIDTLSAFVRRPDELAQTTQVAGDEAVLKATSNLSLVTQLSDSVHLAAKANSIAAVSPDLLLRVIAVLRARVAESTNLLTEAGALDGEVTSPNVSLGVISANITLTILTAPGVPRNILVEELLEDIVALLRTVSQHHIFPLCDPLYKASKQGKKRAKGRSRNSRASLDSDLDLDYDQQSAPKKTSSRHSLNKKDEALLDLCYSFLDLLTTLFRKEPFLPDSIVPQCASVCIKSLSVTGIVRFQSHAIRTACAIFFSYPAHRLPMLDEVREAASAVPASRKHLKTYQLSDGGGAVRASTGLLLLLICTASCDPGQQPMSEQRTGKLSDEAKHAWFTNRITCGHRAVKMAMHVLEPFFNRACTDRDAEFRTAFQTFFEDVLSMYGRPEWPSAELILQTLSVAIITKLRSQEEKSVYARGVATDTLGALAAKMCILFGTRILRDSDLTASFSVSTEALEVEREQLLLYLNPEKSLHFFAANSFCEATFLIDDSKLSEDLKRRSKRIDEAMDVDADEVLDGGEGNSKENEADPQRNSLKRAQNVKSRWSRGEEVSRSEAEKATKYIGANRNFASGFKTILGALLEGMGDQAPTIRAKSIKALKFMDDACNGLVRRVPHVVPHIEASCRDVSTLARDAALDLLSRSLLADFDQKDAQHEDSPNVGATDCSAEDRAVFEKIFDIVLKRLWDTATSVRKRAIAIMRTMLSESLLTGDSCRKAPVKSVESIEKAKECEERIIRICTNLVPRLDDPEPSVRDAAERALRYCLFGFDMSTSLTRRDADDPAPADELTERLISVFVQLSANIHLSFVSRVVDKALWIKQKRLLASIVNAAVEKLHGYEAELSSISEGRPVKSLPEEKRMELHKLSQRRVACSSVICAFGSLDAALIEPHCRSLAPSIKGVLDGHVSEADLVSVQRVLKVLEIGIGKASTMESSFIDEVVRDVEIIVCQSPVVLLEEASVRCLCVVSRKALVVSQGSSVVSRAAGTFKMFLDDGLEALKEAAGMDLPSKEGVALERNARCAAVRLGLLARYGVLSDKLIAGVYQTLQKFFSAVAAIDLRGVMSRAAVRALSHFVIRHRNYLSQTTDVFVTLLEREGQDTGDAAIRLAIFQGFHELLRDEEERNASLKEGVAKEAKNDRKQNSKNIEAEEWEGLSASIDSDVQAQNGKEKQKSKDTVVLAAEEDAEAGFLALSAQAVIPSLKKAVHSYNAGIRRTVSNILGLLVRQGLLLPATIVTPLFTLLLDRDGGCREYALRVVGFIADRHSGMLASATVPALRVCFKSSFAVYIAISKEKRAQSGAEEDGEGINDVTLEKICAVALDGKSGMSLLSGALMSLRREQRRGVLEAVLGEFDPRIVVLRSGETGEALSGETRATEYEIGRSAGKGAGADNTNIEEGVGGRTRVPVVEDDDYVGEINEEIVDVRGRADVCALPTLFFLAVTLANMDYTNGAGVGGSLVQGGGTAAADVKLKNAREEVNELVTLATRTISNSGQALLRVVKKLQGSGSGSELEKKRRVALWAARVGVLVRLKEHLKVERWKNVVDEGREEDEVGGDAVGVSVGVRMPEFRCEDGMLPVVGWGVRGVADVSEGIADEQMRVFERLMKEDAIDETDVGVPAWRRSGQRARKSARPRARASGGGAGGGGSGARTRRSSGGVGSVVVGGGEAGAWVGSAGAGARSRKRRTSAVGKRRRYVEGSDEEEDCDFEPDTAHT